MNKVDQIIKTFEEMSPQQQEQVRRKLLNISLTKDVKLDEFVSENRFSKGRACPLCGSTSIRRNGHDKCGTQRYLCNDCHKTFASTTNSIVSGTKKHLSVWEKYIDCMMNGDTIIASAQKCGIHKNTSFAWRHKILDALQSMADSTVLDGIIEADEAFFDISYKGNHINSKTFKMPRAAHRRGHDTHIRGISNEKVCIPCAVNRNGKAISKVTNIGRLSIENLHFIYDEKIDKTSTLVTDKMNSYCEFSKSNGIELIQLKGKQSRLGFYNIQHVNNYHSQLKNFIRRFHGVSTKYLNNYLTWHNFVNYSKKCADEKKKVLLIFVLTAISSTKYRDMSNRLAIPIAA